MDILFKAAANRLRNIGGLFLQSCLSMTGSPVDHQDADQDTAYDAKGCSCSGHSLRNLPVGKIQLREHIAQCTSRSVSAYKTNRKLDAEHMIQIV